MQYGYGHGYDYGYAYNNQIAKLKEDLATLKEKVNDFSVDYLVYAQSIKDAKQFSCSGTEGELKDALQNTRNYLNQVQADARAIHDFYASTIRPDVVALKQFKAQQLNKIYENKQANTFIVLLVAIIFVAAVGGGIYI